MEMVRGHHSGVSRAVQAHRQLVEDRQMRKTDKNFEPFNASQAQPEYIIANQVTQQNAQTTQTEAQEETKTDPYNQYMIEPPTSMAKMATVWSFQNSEPGRPGMTDPIPKGSYLDVQG